MQDATVAVLREAGHYLIAWVSLAAQLFMPFLRHSRVRPKAARPHSDATWFLPVYLWGLCSLHHAWWFLVDSGLIGCWGVPAWVFASHAAFSFAVLALVIALCFLTERLARRRGAAARECAATLPLPLLAIIVGVAGCWFALLFAIFPLR